MSIIKVRNNITFLMLQCFVFAHLRVCVNTKDRWVQCGDIPVSFPDWVVMCMLIDVSYLSQ